MDVDRGDESFVYSTQKEACDLDDDRFSQLVEELELNERKDSRIPINTRYNSCWALNVWRDWAIWRNGKMAMDLSSKNQQRRYKRVPLLESRRPDDDEFGYWLCRFVNEIKKQDGTDYPARTIWKICCGIQRALREDDKMLHIFDEANPSYDEFLKQIDARMKELTAAGVGIEPERADPISKKDEEQLWNTNTINLTTSQGLSNGVFFYACKLFGLRGMDEHTELMAEQFTIKYDEEAFLEKLMFKGGTCKTYHGGLKDLKYEPKKIEQYSDPRNDRCVVNLFKIYLQHIPPKGRFYRRPILSTSGAKIPRFSVQALGKNKMKVMIKSMCLQAGINLEGKKLTNHSGKVTCCTSLFDDEFDDSVVRSRSGHTSTAVNLYKRQTVGIKKKVSGCLQAPKPGKMIKPSCTNTQANLFTSSSTEASITENNTSQVNEATFQKYYDIAKACGSKSITIDLKSEKMTINVD